ncbi:EthD domain-containing protein [Novosphingobium kaempferiae]|uniref:EthD domain-containing protein n=1 Tax=Novosphingobium kaempferiae TaxID=2896849 RepID=UPI001E516F66|nr:EthD domain-containing protein [Novosphingobium kaempferiae]
MAYKILLFMKRRPDISVEAFRDYYETRHAPLAEKYSRGVSRYIRRYIDPQPHPETGAFTDGPDVITELWFDDEKVWRATLGYITTSLMPDEIVADEANLFDRASFRIATVVERESEPRSLADGPGASTSSA